MVESKLENRRNHSLDIIMNHSVIEIISTYYHYVFQRSVGFAIVGSLLITCCCAQSLGQPRLSFLRREPCNSKMGLLLYNHASARWDFYYRIMHRGDLTYLLVDCLRFGLATSHRGGVVIGNYLCDSL
jgi:hypothetical protein